MPDRNQNERGEQTREALLEAAIEIFGRDGYHAASNRAMARQAGVNQALIGYHFGSKRGIYQAVFEFISKRIAENMQPLVDDIENELARLGPGKDSHLETCIACMEKLLCGFADMVTQEKIAWARLVLQEQQDPSEAFELLFAGVMRRIIDTLTHLSALALGRSMDEPAVRICALSLIGQVLVFRAANAAAIRHMQWTHISHDERQLIKQHIHRNLNALFKPGESL